MGRIVPHVERGALNKILNLTEKEKANGVIAASAGNHAQAVAYHAGKLGILHKDIAIAAAIAQVHGTPIPLLHQVETMGRILHYQQHAADGHIDSVETKGQS